MVSLQTKVVKKSKSDLNYAMASAPLSDRKHTPHLIWYVVIAFPLSLIVTVCTQVVYHLLGIPSTLL